MACSKAAAARRRLCAARARHHAVRHHGTGQCAPAGGRHRLCAGGAAEPGLAALLALRARLGIDGWVTRLVALADVLGEHSVRVTPVASDAEIAPTRAVLEALADTPCCCRVAKARRLPIRCSGRRWCWSRTARDSWCTRRNRPHPPRRICPRGTRGNRRMDRPGHARAPAVAAADPQSAGRVPVMPRAIPKTSTRRARSRRSTDSVGRLRRVWCTPRGFALRWCVAWRRFFGAS